MCIRLGDTQFDIDLGSLLKHVPAVAFVVSIMLMLKLHYSSASAEQLLWILGPTARLTGWFTKADFAWEDGIGYTDFSHGIIVAPACAGINFMIMAFGAAALCGLYHLEGSKGRAVWIGFALAASYGMALLVNTSRIAISMLVFYAHIEYWWLTAARIHRVAGVLLYFAALWIYIQIAWHAARSFGEGTNIFHKDSSSSLASWMVLGWYLMGAIGVPLVNGAWKTGEAPFVEHSLTVGSVALTVFLAALFVRELLRLLFRWTKARAVANASKVKNQQRKG